jgi:hypothetical protein
VGGSAHSFIHSLIHPTAHCRLLSAQVLEREGRGLENAEVSQMCHDQAPRHGTREFIAPWGSDLCTTLPLAAVFSVLCPSTIMKGV